MIHGTMTISSKKDYLSILGLSNDFDDKELKKAFRREARKWHPVLNKNDLNAEERFKLINEAYEYLSDPNLRKNSALTLIAQAERRLRDASLEFGPYGAERQQRAVELAIQDVEEYIDDDDPQELEISVSALQEALFGLNRKFAAERKTDNNPLQGIKNTFGSLKDELFSDDYWDDDPWDNQMNRNYRNPRYGNSRDDDPWDNDYFL